LNVPLYGNHPGMYAFDEKTGKQVWASRSPGQFGFESPPTAGNGFVYATGEEHGGTFYAYNETTGKLAWTAAVPSGEDSAPVVTPDGIYASFSCPQTYDFQPATGKLIWNNYHSCRGNSQNSSALYKGYLFAGGSNTPDKYDGTILNPETGKSEGGFVGGNPAFAHVLGFFVNGSTLTARTVPTMKQVWSVSIGSGYYGYNTPPIVVGNTVFIETVGSDLAGYDVTNGKQKAFVKLTNMEYNSDRSSLAFGDGLLVVPDATTLVALQGS
jgi:outer membrane protein assembly factor BamB